MRPGCFLWCLLEFNQNSLAFAPQLLLLTNQPWYLYIALLPSKELLSESPAFFLGPPSRLPLPLISFAQASPLSSPALAPSQPARMYDLHLLLFPPPQKSHQTQRASREISFCLCCDNLTSSQCSLWERTVKVLFFSLDLDLKNTWETRITDV